MKNKLILVSGIISILFTACSKKDDDSDGEFIINVTEKKAKLIGLWEERSIPTYYTSYGSIINTPYYRADGTKIEVIHPEYSECGANTIIISEGYFQYLFPYLDKDGKCENNIYSFPYTIKQDEIINGKDQNRNMRVVFLTEDSRYLHLKEEIKEKSDDIPPYAKYVEYSYKRKEK